MTYALQAGSKLITDITNARSDEIDLPAIERNLRNIRRFLNNPIALTIHDHRALVRLLAERHGASEPVRQWAYHHDDHEGIIGDILAPLESLISDHTNILEIVKYSLDAAICKARGIPLPSEATRREVHVYDKMAATIEWLEVLGQPPADWNVSIDLPLAVQRDALYGARDHSQR